MTVLCVDPAQYSDAATYFGQVGSDANETVSKLSGSLGGFAGMAGSDNAGSEWGHGYDDAARSALEAAASAVTGAGQVATLLHATGQNHAQADASSTIGGGNASVPAAPTSTKASMPHAPSAVGGSGGGPHGWSLVAHLVGYAWPNGHQDQLHAAQAAWSAAAAGLGAASGPVSAAASAVQAQQSPEAPAAAAACTQVGSHLHDLADAFTQVGQSCTQYATHLDQAHHEILSELKSLLIQTAAIEGGGAVLAVFTIGLDEIPTQGLAAARIAAAAAKIRRIIEVLIEAARTVAAAVKGVGAKALEILAKLKPLVEAGAKRAETAAVDGVEEAGVESSATAGLPSAATKVAGVDYGLPVQDAMKILGDDPAAELARLHDGGIPSKLLEGYDPLAGRSAEEFEHEFAVQGKDGNLHWDWDKQAPDNGFANKEVTDRFPTDHEFDRLGHEDGGFLADKGAPLEDRGMPPGAATQYSSYVGTGRPVPDEMNWEVQYGPAKEAFGQPGGVNQWAVIDRDTKLPVSVADLVKAGMIR